MLAVGRDDRGKSIVCILDALDECFENDRRRLTDKLSSFYQHSTKEQQKRKWLKFLVTSRPYDNIASSFAPIKSSFPEIRLRGEDENVAIQKEIMQVIKIKIKGLAEWRNLGHTKSQQLEQQLMGMKNRTYLWLQLVFGSIEETFQNSLRPDEQEIEALPASVEDAYERILSKATQKWSILRKILEIVIGARRPLDLCEMASALDIATRPQGMSAIEGKISEQYLKDNIRGWCGLFIFLDNSKIYLIHQTAKEFLLAREEVNIMKGQWKHSLRLATCESVLAEICVERLSLENPLQYISMDQPAERKTLSYQVGQDGSPSISWNKYDRFMRKRAPTRLGLMLYSQKYWADHLHEATTENQDALTTKALRVYEKNLGLFRKMSDKVREPEAILQESDAMLWSRGSMIKQAALNGHCLVLARLVSIQEARPSRDLTRAKNNALVYAVIARQWQAVEMLLNCGADPNHHLWDINSQAGSRWRNQILDYRAIFGDTPRDRKVNGTSHHRMVDGTPRYRSNRRASELEGGTSLHVAAFKNEQHIMQMLLQKEVDINARAWTWGIAPLHLAALAGHVNMVIMLLQNGADVEAKSSNGHTPYHLAVLRYRTAVVSIFMAQYANRNLTGRSLDDTRQTRNRNHLEKKVHHLPNVNIDLVFVLQAAGRSGGESLVRYLDDALPNETPRQRKPRHPLKMGVILNRDAFAQLSFKDDNVVSTEKSFLNAPFIAAVLYDQAQIVQGFLDAGEGFGDREVSLAFQIAVTPGHEGVLQLLLNWDPKTITNSQLFDALGFSPPSPIQTLVWTILTSRMGEQEAQRGLVLRHQNPSARQKRQTVLQ